ncbi:MAG: T9SS type A sorting domain-containing protein [Bacteroidaceae bacterium]|nr:T9SS type A sorting domain-containing protein [Bacteroidaceae bacterium]MBQ8675865.1 T9SS type A sorting domain-containing protein [Bacteroidaceae bacterium]MBQ9175372.1 T9SS type A sorting domain-containing protein [Bacteroidaceae bacterium]MBR1377823.1 T9SS type A sorting domain-containing protein [Bacteroidaceae bacterium]
MKRITTILMLAFAICHATSVEAKSLVLVMSDSTRVYFLLDDTPVMKFNGGNITVDTKTYAFTDIVRFYISATDDPSGIEQLMAKEEVKWEGGTLLLQGKKDVEVYDINGRKQEVKVTTTADNTFVDTNSLPKGTYVMKSGKTSLKFMKK